MCRVYVPQRIIDIPVLTHTSDFVRKAVKYRACNKILLTALYDEHLSLKRNHWVTFQSIPDKTSFFSVCILPFLLITVAARSKT
jgi:hypothetical protein